VRFGSRVLEVSAACLSRAVLRTLYVVQLFGWLSSAIVAEGVLSVYLQLSGHAGIAWPRSRRDPQFVST
jgi:hypothetical protein